MSYFTTWPSWRFRHWLQCGMSECRLSAHNSGLCQHRNCKTVSHTSATFEICDHQMFLQGTGSLGPRYHTVRQAATLLHQLKVECLEHPPNCPSLPPNNFHLIRLLKKQLGIPTLQNVVAVNGTEVQWFRSQNPDCTRHGHQHRVTVPRGGIDAICLS
jgi:hypothetical protein